MKKWTLPKIDYIRHLKYHARWQSGFIVCYPTMWLFSDYLELPLWLSIVLFQFVGASIFYHVDKYIFKKKGRGSSSVG